MSPLQIQTTFVAIVALGSSAWAQDAEQPPIDPYAGTDEADEPVDSTDEAAPPAEKPDSTLPIDRSSSQVPAKAQGTGTGRTELPAYPVMPQPEQPKAIHRSGLMGGLALGFGSLGAGNDSNGTVNYTVSFGGYLSNSLALLVDLWGGRVQDEDFRIHNYKQGVSALYWISSSLWTKASIGSASYTTYVGDVMLSEFSGVALGAGLGWEFYERGNFHLDARFSLTIEGYKNARDNVSATALQIGLHYF